MVTEDHGTWDCCPEDAFAVKKLLTKGAVEVHHENYWLAPHGKPAEFVLDLGCNKIVNVVKLVNTHNGDHRDRSSKEIKVSISSSRAGPWSQVLHETLEDSRKQSDPLPVLSFPIYNEDDGEEEFTARFVKFNLISWYGGGGGLQYFAVKKGEKPHTMSLCHDVQSNSQTFYIYSSRNILLETFHSNQNFIWQM